jgi:predicted hotdog family 3-hydroxylacyl-ACP dehydratase
VITSFKDLACAQEWLDPALALTVRTELVYADDGHAVHRCEVWQGAAAAAPVVSATVYTKESEA